MRGSTPANPIQKMILGRLGIGIFTLFVISIIIFLAISLLPGDIAEQVLGQSATPETVAAFRRELGLDDEDYRTLLESVTGARSAKGLSVALVQKAAGGKP